MSSQPETTKAITATEVETARMPDPNKWGRWQEEGPNTVGSEKKYKLLKRKLKYLLYEQEAMTNNLRQLRRKALKMSREKDFILDRLLKYEDVASTTSGGSSTSSSEESDDEDLSILEDVVLTKKEVAAKKVEDSKAGNTKQKRSEALAKSVKKLKKEPLQPVQSLAPVPAKKRGGTTKCMGPDNCKRKPLDGLSYCRPHAPLDPTSGYIYCTHMDENLKEPCYMVVKEGMSNSFCIAHRRQKAEVPKQSNKIKLTLLSTNRNIKPESNLATEDVNTEVAPSPTPNVEADNGPDTTETTNTVKKEAGVLEEEIDDESQGEEEQEEDNDDEGGEEEEEDEDGVTDVIGEGEGDLEREGDGDVDGDDSGDDGLGAGDEIENDAMDLSADSATDEPEYE